MNELALVKEKQVNWFCLQLLFFDDLFNHNCFQLIPCHQKVENFQKKDGEKILF